MLLHIQSWWIVFLVNLTGTHALSFFQGTSPKIIQDVVWLYSNSTSLDYTNTEFSPIFYDESINPLTSDMSQINKTGLRGILYDRGYSCSTYNNTNNNINSALPFPIYNSTDSASIPKVALIKIDNQCSFGDKIMNAQIDGASACIIYDPNSEIIKTPNVNIYNGSVIIPVFHVKNDIGQRLFNQLNGFSMNPHSLSFNNNIGSVPVTANQVVRVLLLPSTSGTPNPWEITLLIMIVFLAVGFISSVCLHTYLWRKNRRLQRMIEEGQLPPTIDMLPMGKRILDPKKIDLFPTRVISEKDVDEINNKQQQTQKAKRASVCTTTTTATASRMDPTKKTASSTTNDATQEMDDNTCVICLDLMDVGQTVRQLPCEHEYHCQCIDPWLTSKSGECPLCKFDCVGHDTSPEEQKATEEAHAYFLNTDVNLFHVFISYLRHGRFVPSTTLSSTPPATSH